MMQLPIFILGCFVTALVLSAAILISRAEVEHVVEPLEELDAERRRRVA